MTQPANETRLRDLWAGPLRFVEIAELLECGHEALRREAKRLGLPHRTHVTTTPFGAYTPISVSSSDGDYITSLMAHGGFIAFPEERYAHRGYLLGFGPWAKRINADFYRCLPLVRAA